MNPSIDLRDVSRRQFCYCHIDGLAELIMGLLWVLWGGASLFGQTLPHNWVWKVYWLIVSIALSLSGFAGSWATRRLRERITYPRAGYAVLHAPSRRQRAGVAAFIIVIALFCAVVILYSSSLNMDRLAAPGLTVILSLGLVAIAVRDHMPHMFAVAGAAIALGATASSLFVGWEAASWFLVGLGLVCAAVGGFRTRHFLNTHPMEAAN